MIDIKELRVGNIIDFKGDKCRITTINYLQPDGLYESFFVVLKNRETYSAKVDDIFPISITEAILLKCGFKEIERKELFKLINIECWELTYKINDDKCPLVIIYDSGCFNHVVPAYNPKECAFYPIKSFHQLQNLYFALTGEELEVDL